LLYEDKINYEHHIALVMGNVAGKKDVLVRVHSQCLTGDVFHSLRCDCGDQLEKALQMIARNKLGVFLYMRQEGRGIGLVNKLKAYHLQDKGLDTVEANIKLGFPPDLRDYGIGAQILADLGLSTVRLLTNNPKKIIGLEGYGLKVVEQIPIFAPNKCNINYLRTKRKKLGHLIPDSVIDNPCLKGGGL
jgi:3,4-dihydroxy 2-butanone 4-phosphate synthase/GTP cyclohydrolase II